MATPLLITKLQPPPLRARQVARARLLTRLDEGVALDRALTLVVAPAGYGKTTLVSSWLEALAGSGRRGTPPAQVWLSLDAADNDPVRFLTYLVAALGTAVPAAAEQVAPLLHGAQQPPLLAMAALLVNELAARADPLVLVLDDLHLVTTQAIHDLLDFLLEHRPPTLHLVLLTREDPPLAISRLRARGQLTELRAGDLRFTPEEASAFFSEVMNLPLESGAVATLAARTEGWIAGLQLAALALSSLVNAGTQVDPGRGAVLAAFLADFGGSHRYVIDYLMDEVLRHQPPPVRDFLIRTSVLNRLSAPLCDAVLGSEHSPSGGSQAMLEALEAASLFLVALDGRRVWYRYHRLFADVLRSNLDPATARELHRRASRWYLEAQQWGDAVEHALAAEAPEDAAAAIMAATAPLLRQGQVATLLGWIEALPVTLVRQHPELVSTQAFGLLMTGQLAPLIAYLSKLDGEGRVASYDAVTQGRLLAIRAWLANAQRHRDVAALAEKALALLSTEDVASTMTSETSEGVIPRVARGISPETSEGVIPRVARGVRSESSEGVIPRALFRILALIPLGNARASVGDLDGAIRIFDEATRLAEQEDQPFAALNALANLAFYLTEQGRRREAQQRCEAAIARYTDARGEPLPIVGLVYISLAVVAYTGNDLDHAADSATRGLALSRRLFSGAMMGGDGEHILAEVHAARGEWEAAFALVDRTRDEAAQQGVTHVVEFMNDVEAGLHLRHGDLAAVARWAEGLAPAGEVPAVGTIPWQAWPGYIGLLIAQGRLALAGDLLDRRAEQLEAHGQVWRLISIQLFRAEVALKQGRRNDAVGIVRRAAELAEPGGYARAFAEAAPEVRALVAELALPFAVTAVEGAQALAVNAEGMARPSASSYGVTDSGTSGVKGAAPPTASREDANAALIEPLTERELEVLDLIAQGLTNREIGERLYVSTGTVKRHAYNLYGKLGATSRTQALARAQELGLL